MRIMLITCKQTHLSMLHHDHTLLVAALVVPLQQAVQQVFKQEVTNGRARSSQLQEALHQRDTDLEAARAQLAAAQQGQAAAEAEQQRLRLQLKGAQQGKSLLQQQVDKVSLGWSQLLAPQLVSDQLPQWQTIASVKTHFR